MQYVPFLPKNIIILFLSLLSSLLSKERRKIKESVKKSGRILFGQPSICIRRRGESWEPIHQKRREREREEEACFSRAREDSFCRGRPKCWAVSRAAYSCESVSSVAAINMCSGGWAEQDRRMETIPRPMQKDEREKIRGPPGRGREGDSRVQGGTLVKRACLAAECASAENEGNSYCLVSGSR